MSSLTKGFKTLSAKAAAQLDQDLMSVGAFSIDQLMELAGLAVAKAVYREYPPSDSSNSSNSSTSPAQKILVLVGPGNNGGDGLVAARHLKTWGAYEPVIYYPKKSTHNQLYANLVKQLENLNVQEITTLDEIKSLLSHRGEVGVILDALFGFSFKPPIRDPFKDVISYLSQNHDTIPPIVSVDIPSGWDVDEGATDVDINASMLVSLSAPKPCAERFVNSGENKKHYLGGRFISHKIAKKYGIEDILEKYKGDELITKL
ncbi:NAD(P)H-hydrate epimerase [Acetobacter pasteurianus]|nr:NAD(P)H-hydrate epimerase [Acetobacter pasteurianus]